MKEKQIYRELSKYFNLLMVMFLLASCSGEQNNQGDGSSFIDEAIAALNEPVQITGPGAGTPMPDLGYTSGNEPTVGETFDQLKPTLEALAGQGIDTVKGISAPYVSEGNKYIQNLIDNAQPITIVIETDGGRIAISGDGAESYEPGKPRPNQEPRPGIVSDPGPTIEQTVEIVTEIAIERGVPPELLLAKFWYEGGYIGSNGQWVGLRNWDTDGQLLKSPSTADCGGVGQVCKFYHPAFDQGRASDLSNPEAALRYSAGFAADYFVQMFEENGSWEGAVLRYHSPSEAQEGLALTKGFLVSPPINPETGKPAWNAQSTSIFAETQLRNTSLPPTPQLDPTTESIFATQTATAMPPTPTTIPMIAPTATTESAAPVQFYLSPPAPLHTIGITIRHDESYPVGHPNRGTDEDNPVRHNGVDFATLDLETNDPFDFSNEPFDLFATCSGLVTFDNVFDGHGFIQDCSLDGRSDVLVEYAHLASGTYPPLNATVERGQPIGRATGEGGSSDGPHLHFEVSLIITDGQQTHYTGTDPLPYFPDFE